MHHPTVSPIEATRKFSTPADHRRVAAALEYPAAYDPRDYVSVPRHLKLTNPRFSGRQPYAWLMACGEEFAHAASVPNPELPAVIVASVLEGLIGMLERWETAPTADVCGVMRGIGRITAVVSRRGAR